MRSRVNLKNKSSPILYRRTADTAHADADAEDHAAACGCGHWVGLDWAGSVHLRGPCGPVLLPLLLLPPLDPNPTLVAVDQAIP